MKKKKLIKRLESMRRVAQSAAEHHPDNSLPKQFWYGYESAVDDLIVDLDRL